MNTTDAIDNLRNLLSTEAIPLNSLPKRGRGHGVGGTATVGPDAIKAFNDLLAAAQRVVDEAGA